MFFPSFSQFTQFHISTPVTANLLIFLFLVIFISWLIHMVITSYHWRNYGNDKKKLLVMNMAYFIGSAVLFVILGVFIAYYSISIV